MTLAKIAEIAKEEKIIQVRQGQNLVLNPSQFGSLILGGLGDLGERISSK